MALTDKLTAIADAIREKAGTSDAMTLAGMAEAIAAIEAGGGGVKMTMGTFTLAENLVIGNNFSYEIEHGLGEEPKYFFLFKDEMYDDAGGSPYTNSLFLFVSSATGYWYKVVQGTATSDTAKADGTWKNPVATESVAYVAGYSSAAYLQANKEFVWLAVGEQK